MKKLALVLFLSIFVIAGCDNGSMLPDPKESKTIVFLERCINTAQDPGIKIACKSATLDYDKRKITIKDASQFGSWGIVTGWIGNISIADNKLILELPNDADYNVNINKQKHFLPQIVSDK